MPLRRLRFPPFASVSLFDPRAVSSSRPAARPGRRAQASSRLGVAVAGPRVPAFPAHALTTVSTASNYAWSGRPRSPRPRRCNAQAAAGRERRPAYHRGTHGPEHSPSVVRARRRLRKLERATFVGNRVVARHDPVLLHAKNISKSLRIAHLHKPAFLRDLWRPREQLVVHRKVDLANVAVSVVTGLRAGAAALAVLIEILQAGTLREIDAAFVNLAQKPGTALLISPDPFFTGRRTQLATLAARHAIPAIYNVREFAESGGLMSYGPNFANVYQQTGIYVGRILKGEKPAELPVEQPTKFELVINLTTARAIGITVPDKLLALADEVIE